MITSRHCAGAGPLQHARREALLPGKRGLTCRARPPRRSRRALAALITAFRTDPPAMELPLNFVSILTAAKDQGLDLGRFVAVAVFAGRGCSREGGGEEGCGPH